MKRMKNKKEEYSRGVRCVEAIKRQNARQYKMLEANALVNEVKVINECVRPSNGELKCIMAGIENRVVEMHEDMNDNFSKLDENLAENFSETNDNINRVGELIVDVNKNLNARFSETNDNINRVNNNLNARFNETNDNINRVGELIVDMNKNLNARFDDLTLYLNNEFSLVNTKLNELHKSTERSFQAVNLKIDMEFKKLHDKMENLTKEGPKNQ